MGTNIYFTTDDITAVYNELYNKNNELTLEEMSARIKGLIGINKFARMIDEFINVTYEEAYSKLIDYIKDKQPDLYKLLNEIEEHRDLIKSIDDKISEIKKIDEDIKQHKVDDDMIESTLSNSKILKNIKKEFNDKLINLKIDIVNHIADKVLVPKLMKDLRINDDGSVDVEIEELFDFEVPIYKYSKKGNVIVLCYVVPVIRDGKVYIDIDRREVGLGKSFLGYMTAIRGLVKLKGE